MHTPLINLRKLTRSILFTGCLSLIPLFAAYASDTQLENLQGEKHKVSEFIGKGKWTVLNIWVTKCPPCREEMPDLVQFHDSHQDSNAIVLGIAIDFPSYDYAKKDQVLAFADEYMIDFPILLSDGNITERLGLGSLEGLPTTYLYTPEGKLAAMQVGAISKVILENYIARYKTD